MLKVITKDFTIGVKSFIKAFVFLFEYNLWLYFFVPVLLFVSMYLGADLLHKNVMNYDIFAYMGYNLFCSFNIRMNSFVYLKSVSSFIQSSKTYLYKLFIYH